MVFKKIFIGKEEVGLLKKLELFELQHKIIAFLFLMILTIVLTRLSVLVHNPNPILLNFELHHFDYGILLLFVSSLLLLFGNERTLLYLFLTAISFGLVLDDFWFIRSNILDPDLTEISVYNSTFPIVVLLVLVVSLMIFIINHYKKK